MNRKPFLILAVFIVLCNLPLFSSIRAEEIDSGKDRTFIFPASLERIEDEAFEGTVAETVIFPVGLISIGSRAFEHVQILKDVYIPDTTTFIADSAFSAADITIHGIDGSYAMGWANSHEIPFVAENIWNTVVQDVKSHNTRTDPIHQTAITIVLITLLEFFRFSCYELRSRRPQDRPELNPIDYRFP